MADIYRKCKRLKIEVPEQVAEFFGYTDPPDDNAAAVDISSKHMREWHNDSREFKEFDLTVLPPGTKRIRIVISY